VKRCRVTFVIDAEDQEAVASWAAERAVELQFGANGLDFRYHQVVWVSAPPRPYDPDLIPHRFPSNRRSAKDDPGPRDPGN
jgi:hypothetical protein